MIPLQGKTNFVEKRVSEYALPQETARAFTTEDDF